MAMEMGSKAKDLAYLSKVGDPFNNFREARELMQKDICSDDSEFCNLKSKNSTQGARV
jgi:hypothetical protein